MALIVSLGPMLRTGTDGKRRIYIAILILAAVTVALIVPTWGGLAEDIYKCEILRIPNCD